ncbi:MAG TPA: DNA translocase FtsK 4TM domain-containing protein [Pyrinomonadaceae bacterium]|nr:DNA translocase FtsK 4TM domain-containing protein [Pyrinomonadaceae bacterium]
MATIQTETRTKVLPAKRGSRRNEMTAIALLAVGAMLALCLFFFHPNDPSLNASGQERTDNLIGPVGAYVSDLLLQTFGLAAYLLPLLLLAAAVRRFQKKPLRAPLGRVTGLALLLLSTAGLLSLIISSLFFDGRVRAGGFVGALLESQLRGAAGRVGALILLTAAAAVAVLLATNFSFAHAYARAVEAFGSPQDFAKAQAARFRAWVAARRGAAAQRDAERQAERAARELAREEEKRLKHKTGAARVEEFMREPLPLEAIAGTAIQRNAAAAEAAATSPPPTISKEIGAATTFDDAPTGAATTSPPRAEGLLDDAPASPSSKRVAQPASRGEGEPDAAGIEEMVRDVSVVRTEPSEGEELPRPRAADKAAREAKKLERVAAAMSDYKVPPVDFLNAAPPRHEQADEELRSLATRVAEKCKEFNVTGKIEYICPGPVVTTYEFKPDPGVKYSRVTGLVDDLCLALRAESIRIDRVPGKAHVGIEVPNARRDNIMLREVVESRQYQETASKLALALGKTIDGLNYVADLARMPHLLIAGATGTGKSVCLNSLVVSILYKARPDEVKFIMIDPKRLELGLYADIPHLATPIITDPKRAANSLKWAVGAMETRYKQLAKWGVRNIDGYNTEVLRRNLVEDFDEEGNPHELLPYIVIIIDELADLMMTSGHEVEEAITRLAQMARAVGIHLILATQRPSVDVITGLIKANFPSRIAFRVSSKVDSRTIIDANGAEQLLGRGDMLFLPPGTSRLVRVHGAFVDEEEIKRIVTHIKAQGQPVYDETITQSEEEAGGGDGAGGERDELFEDALRICVEMKRASTSVLQRRLRVGYGRAAAILDAMEREGLIGQADGARPRPVLGKAFETINHWDELERSSG